MSSERLSPQIARRRWPTAAGVLVLVILSGCSSRSTGGTKAANPVVRAPADPATCPVPHGRVLAGRLTSQVLGPQRFRIYLPPRYDAASNERYPVLYLLHGATADETQWEDVGIGQGADCLLAGHHMRPTLIVLLDAGIAEVQPNGASEVQRFVLLEAIPTIDQRYPTIADRQHRAIGGISMGGGWALRIAADHPDRFSAVGGHSPAVRLTERQRASLSSRKVRVWLDVGASETLRSPVTGLARTLEDGGAAVSLRVWPGAHDRRYWSHHIQAYLRFYTARW